MAGNSGFGRPVLSINWRRTSLAWDLHRKTGNVESASARRAPPHIAALAGSFQPGEPLCEAFERVSVSRRIPERELETEW